MPLSIRDRRVAGTGTDGHTLSLFAGPLLSFFARPGHHLDVMLEGELGGKLQSGRSGRFLALSLSVGYLLSAQVIAESIDLATGDRTKIREWRHAITPSLNFTFGRELRARFGWFGKLSVGNKRSLNVGNSLFYMVELGIQWRARSRTAGGKKR